MNYQLIKITTAKIEKITTLIRNDILINQKEEYLKTNDIILVNKNARGEITYIDFNLENSYCMLKNIVLEMQQSLKKFENGDYNIADIYILDDVKNEEKISKNNFIIKVPIGMFGNNPYMKNIGPKIMVKLKLYGSVVGSIKTKITPYGINNALIETYINLLIKEQVLLPFQTKNIETNVNFLIGSKVIDGAVPSLYNGVIQKESSLVNIPLNN